MKMHNWYLFKYTDTLKSPMAVSADLFKYDFFLIDQDFRSNSCWKLNVNYIQFLCQIWIFMPKFILNYRSVSVINRLDEQGIQGFIPNFFYIPTNYFIKSIQKSIFHWWKKLATTTLVTETYQLIQSNKNWMFFVINSFFIFCYDISNVY